MTVFKSGIAVLAVATVAGTVGIGAAITGGEREARKPVGVSGETLNRQHALDEKRAMRASVPQRAHELRNRIEVFNRMDRYVGKPSSAPTPAWLRALIIRSEALNNQHKVGE